MNDHVNLKSRPALSECGATRRNRRLEPAPHTRNQQSVGRLIFPTHKSSNASALVDCRTQPRNNVRCHSQPKARQQDKRPQIKKLSCARRPQPPSIVGGGTRTENPHEPKGRASPKCSERHCSAIGNGGGQNRREQGGEETQGQGQKQESINPLNYHRIPSPMRPQRKRTRYS